MSVEKITLLLHELRQAAERAGSALERLEREKRLRCATFAVAASSSPSPPSTAPALIHPLLANIDGELLDVVKRSMTAIDTVFPNGGVVRILDLRRFLAGVPRPALDAALFELQRRWLVDLSIAQSPATLSPEEREAAIEMPNGRGLAAYIMRRA
jgi:hypothetical protein